MENEFNLEAFFLGITTTRTIAHEVHWNQYLLCKPLGNITNLSVGMPLTSTRPSGLDKEKGE